MGTYSYTINTGAAASYLITLAWSQVFPSNCPAITYAIQVSGGGAVDANVFTLTASNQIKVASSDPGKIGSYSLQVVGSVIDPVSGATYIFTTVPFTVNIICTVTSLAPTSPSLQTYTVGDAMLTFPFSSFVSTPACINTITYTATYLGAPIASPFSIISSSQTISVLTLDNTQSGSYSILLKGAVDSVSSNVYFTITILKITCSNTVINPYAISDASYIVNTAAT